MNNKYALYTERMWMVIAIAAFLYAVYEVAFFGWQEWTYFLGFGLAGSMYLFRRMLRKRFEKHKQQ